MRQEATAGAGLLHAWLEAAASLMPALAFPVWG